MVLQRTLVPLVPSFAPAGHNSRSAGYQATKDGLHPVPVKVGKHAFVPSDELAKVINARVAGRGDDEIRALVRDLHAKRAEAAV